MSCACERCGCESYVVDFTTGDESCRNCGLVMATYAVVETYQFQCRDENDPDDVVHAPMTEEQAALAPVSHIEYRTMSTKERNIYNARRDIKALCERLLLTKVIEEEATDLAVKYEQNRAQHGRKADQHVLLGLIHLASKRVNQTRTLERLCRESGLADDTTKIKRLYQDTLKKVLKMDEGFIDIRQLVNATVAPIQTKLSDKFKYRYMSNIADMADYCEKENPGNRRPGPIAIILACTCMIIDHFNLGMSVDEVVKTYNEAFSQNTATNTIKTCLNSWKNDKDCILSLIK